MKKRYITNCTESTAEKISNMVDNAKEIKYNTFLKHVKLNDLKSMFHFYSWNNDGGLKMKNDYAVSFYKSKYEKKPCVFVCWSAIEYIFI